MLLAVTCVWGSSFIVVRNVLQDAPPFQFLFWRFLLATLLLVPFLLRRRPTPGLWPAAMAAGALLAAAMSFQVAGQVDTTASKAAFLTGLSVVLTPFAAYVRSRRLPSLENGLGIALAGVGFVLLTFPSDGNRLQRGDLLVFACGVVFAFYIVELSERAPAHDPVWMTAIQLAMVTALGGTLALLLSLPGLEDLRSALSEARTLSWDGPFLWSVLYLGSAGTVGTFFGQTWAQRHMSATHAAVLFALEPVVAALLAAWLLNETLGGRGIAGGGFVLAGIVVSELRLGRRGRR